MHRLPARLLAGTGPIASGGVCGILPMRRRAALGRSGWLPPIIRRSIAVVKGRVADVTEPRPRCVDTARNGKRAMGREGYVETALPERRMRYVKRMLESAAERP